MAPLTTAARKVLPKSDFVEPAKKGYPIEDENHARNALARSSGKPVHTAVVAKVKKKFPNIKVDGNGYVVNQGGRPRTRRGTSDGTMVRHVGRKS